MNTLEARRFVRTVSPLRADICVFSAIGRRISTTRDISTTFSSGICRSTRSSKVQRPSFLSFSFADAFAMVGREKQNFLPHLVSLHDRSADKSAADSKEILLSSNLVRIGDAVDGQRERTFEKDLRRCGTMFAAP